MSNRAEAKKEVLSLNQIKPYWRNPRKNDKAVDAVKKSIEEYGYKVLIIVDTDYTIIAGHTRYKALRQLDYDEVECIVADLSPDKARQFRLAENKSAEIADWDEELLDYELRQVNEIENLLVYFNEGELDDLIDEADFEFEEEDPEELLEKVKDFAPTGEEIKNAKEKVKKKSKSDEIDSEDFKNKLKELREQRLTEQNEQIKNMDKERQEEFVHNVEETINDYVEIECPYCDKTYTVSLAEIKRMRKYQQDDTFEN